MAASNEAKSPFISCVLGGVHECPTSAFGQRPDAMTECGWSSNGKTLIGEWSGTASNGWPTHLLMSSAVRTTNSCWLGTQSVRG